MLDRAANVVMFGFFVWAAGLQSNDPDPLLWIGIYGGAAAACALVLFRRLPWPLPGLLGAGCLAFTAVLSARVLGRQSLLYSEEGREMLGLLLVAIWMGYLVARERRQASAPVA